MVFTWSTQNHETQVFTSQKPGIWVPKTGFLMVLGALGSGSEGFLKMAFKDF